MIMSGRQMAAGFCVAAFLAMASGADAAIAYSLGAPTFSAATNDGNYLHFINTNSTSSNVQCELKLTTSGLTMNDGSVMSFDVLAKDKPSNSALRANNYMVSSWVPATLNTWTRVSVLIHVTDSGNPASVVVNAGNIAVAAVNYVNSSCDLYFDNFSLKNAAGTELLNGGSGLSFSNDTPGSAPSVVTVSVASGTTLVVESVPEPASVAFLTCAGLLALGGQSLRKK